jgi:hypothetical protein
VLHYSECAGRLSKGERKRALKIFDELLPRIPKRSEREVEKELKAGAL